MLFLTKYTLKLTYTYPKTKDEDVCETNPRASLPYSFTVPNERQGGHRGIRSHAALQAHIASKSKQRSKKGETKGDHTDFQASIKIRTKGMVEGYLLILTFL